ncbi:hypothetical protein HFC69_00210 [Pediococcus sp. EKM202D]|uniref:hypothetical protein n=1 Tax=Pediococcus TaxID=1253 RepID=UPI00142DC951|nr:MULTISPECIES: hypothetical protein [Pediococcus]KAF5440715.1 hypothetical protein HFC69_00210 [Pediococcus sp. EKM202D]KAF5441722.1 hypothetical protein HFC68_02670 [Pediococcus sp. EKM201D]MEB3376800.1 hypothetical protein [Pediococcus pentosaceus]
MEAEKIVVPVEVNNTELKETLKIAKELNAELEKANLLLGRLAGRNQFVDSEELSKSSSSTNKSNNKLRTNRFV